MRPIANFTLHAVFAAALAALAASSAAAQYQAGHFYLQLDGNDEGMVGSAEGERKGDWIEIDSWQFGGAAAGAAGSDMVLKGTKIGQNAPAATTGGVAVAVGDVNGDARERLPLIPRTTIQSPRDSASGQASGKRQHKPVTITKEVDRADLVLPRPLPQGSVRVKVKTPWLACRVGARYPVLVLGGGGQRYRLLDATVSSCGGAAGPEESITFVYGKLG